MLAGAFLLGESAEFLTFQETAGFILKTGLTGCPSSIAPLLLPAQFHFIPNST
jgi:hypothetical protein